MSQLGRFDNTFLTPLGLPAVGASCAVYREGATVNGNQSGTTPLAVTVRHAGKIATGDSVFINTATSTTYSATRTSATVITLSGFVGTLAVSGGDRITPANSLPTLYSDDQGGATTGNPLTTSSLGRAQCWMEGGVWDFIVSGGGSATTAFTSQITVDAATIEFNVRAFGATGDGTTDDSAAIQAAIDNAESVGGGTVYIPVGTYKIVTGLTIENSNVRLFGGGRGTILKPASAITMITGDTSNANVGNMVAELYIDFDSTASTGIYLYNGNSWVVRNINFVNPAAGSIGIHTTNGAPEIEIHHIDWWHSAALGTCMIIDTNNNRISDCSIICATVGIDLSPVAAISPCIIQKCRIKSCGTGIRLNTRGMLGLFISDMRFEGNTAYDMDIVGFDNGNNRAFGVSIENIYTSTGANWKFRNVRGLNIDTVIFKEWTVSGPAIVDGGNNDQIHVRNLVIDSGTTTTPLLPSTWVSSGYESLTQNDTQIGNGTDAPVSSPLQFLVNRAGAAGLGARDSTNNAEINIVATSSATRVTSKTAHSLALGTNNSDKVTIATNGAMYHNVITTFSSLDATPSVSLGNIFKTANGSATTITDFDGGTEGQIIHVIINDANTTIDFTSTNLKGNGGSDWSPTTNDSMICVYVGTTWYCRISDNTA